MYAEASNIQEVKLHGNSEGYKEILGIFKGYKYLDEDIDLDALYSGLEITYIRYDLRG